MICKVDSVKPRIVLIETLFISVLSLRNFFKAQCGAGFLNHTKASLRVPVPYFQNVKKIS